MDGGFGRPGLAQRSRRLSQRINLPEPYDDLVPTGESAAHHFSPQLEVVHPEVISQAASAFGLA
jgi:hypothetical protein